MKLILISGVALLLLSLIRMIYRASKVPKVSPDLRNKILGIEKEFRQAEKEGRPPKFK